MSFTLALQSLAFYLISCAPCYGAINKYRVKEQARKRREQRKARGEDTEGYQQPEPFSTNPYWSEEIRMGPHITRRVYQPPSKQTKQPKQPEQPKQPKKPEQPKQPPPLQPTVQPPDQPEGAGSVASSGSWETVYYHSNSGSSTDNPTIISITPTKPVAGPATATPTTATTAATTPNTTTTNTTTATTVTTATTATTATTPKSTNLDISRANSCTNSDNSTGTTVVHATSTRGTKGTKTAGTTTTSDTSANTFPRVSPKKKTVKCHVTDGHGSDVVISESLAAPSPTLEKGRFRLSPDMMATLPHNWNHKRYQREDEDFWGSELSRTGHKLMDAIKNAGSSAGRFIESSLGKDVKLNSAEEDEEKSYFIPINHPLNDHHPPLARRPPFKGTVSWMVAPPPPAKVMEGKVPVRRGSSVSNTSRRTALSDKPVDGALSNSLGSSGSKPSRHAAPSGKAKEGDLPASRGSSASNASQRTTASANQSTRPAMTLAEMV
ncbi:hypothetical protein F4802DRAFT_230445 [Xylaria palmicola]|nr:hypothetical protein F4802DRAFT_230445 [Xylaria palmicola]